MVVVISLDLQMLAKVLNVLRALPIFASTLPKYVKDVYTSPMPVLLIMICSLALHAVNPDGLCLIRIR